MSITNKTIIAGPCALESKEQLVSCIEGLKKLGIKYIRASLWKPRTNPGWEGLAFYGLPLLFEETLSRGVIPCTEILSSFHAQMVVDALRICGIKDAGAVVWLGARNQNHFEQKRIAKILSEGPPGLIFMFKNQIWLDKRHWFGIYEHIMSVGFPKERLCCIHRGFTPGYSANPENLRNIPEFAMAMEMKEKMGIPMYLDPSHIGGERSKVIKIIEQSLEHNFDGYIIEVHDNISIAKTDAVQQLTFDQMKEVQEMIERK
ncbi:MAG: hypothetical protein H0U27_00590 [Nitrosopumilus sp.]|nr:hypothetical protein [Nitrosopumilus sp.]